jgi:hypothetical protein
MAALAQPAVCSVAVSGSTYKDLREFLADEGEDSLAAIERFVDEAIRTRIFEETVRQIKAANVGVSEEEMMATIDEALEWARAQK